MLALMGAAARLCRLHLGDNGLLESGGYVRFLADLEVVLDPVMDAQGRQQLGVG